LQAELSGDVVSENNHVASSMTSMNYIGLDVQKKTIGYGVKDVSGRIQQEGKGGWTRRKLDCWMKTLPQPWSAAMEATIFSDQIYLDAYTALKKNVTNIFSELCPQLPSWLRDRVMSWL
jgi:hypothetical protein